MKKIISFSLWGNSPKYNVGAIRNSKLAKELFPDWTVRFYCGQSVPNDTIDMLAVVRGDLFTHEETIGKTTVLYSTNFNEDESGNINDVGGVEVVCMPEPGDWRGMFWRFHAAGDPDCEAMISRDCDSRLSKREKEAVDEWLASDKGFHTIHDHFHHNVPILGGLWGKKRECFPEFSVFLDAWPQEDRWQTDQDFLTQVVWPRVANQTMNHSEFHTHIWPARPIPLPRSGREFIGATYNEHDVIDAEQQRLLYGR